MKREVEICDKCKTEIATKKCFICKKKLCNGCSMTLPTLQIGEKSYLMFSSFEVVYATAKPKTICKLHKKICKKLQSWAKTLEPYLNQQADIIFNLLKKVHKCKRS